MPKLPRYTATVPPPREAGAARAGDITSLTQTGEAAKLRALGGIGKAISGLSETFFKRQAIDDQIEYGSATQRTEEQANQGIAAADILDVTMDMPLPDDPKYLETLTSFSTVKRDGLIVGSLKEYDSSVAKIAQGISNPRNRDKFITWSGARRVVYKEELRKKYTRKLHDYQESKLNEFRLSAARNGDVKAADQWADIMDKRELITPEAARILKEKNKQIADRQSIWNLATSIVRPDGEVDWSEAVEWFSKAENIKGIDSAIIDALLEDAKTQAVLQRGRDVENLETQQKIERQGILNKFVKKDLKDIVGYINSLRSIDPTEKLSWINTAESRAEAILTKKDSPYTKSDPVVEARILDQIRDPSAKISEKDISDLIGKGLSIDDASRMIAMLDFFKDPWFQRIDMFYKSQLGWDGAYEKFMHPQGGISYKLASDQLFDAIETRELRGRDIYEQGTEIALPHIISYWENVLGLEKPEVERMTTLLRGTQAAKPGEGREAELVDEWLKEKTKGSKIDPKGIFR